MNDIKEFELIGGAPSLDFINTADGDMRGEWTERLERYSDLIAWSQQNGLLDEEAAKSLLKKAAQHPAEAEAVLYETRAIRKHLFYLFSAIAADETPANEDLSAFSRGLQEALAQVQLTAFDGHFQRAWPDDLHTPLWQVMAATEDLLRSERIHLVRECGGNDCSWLFLDTSRNHSRRWCTMDGCGNRAKARNHYRRVKDRTE